MTLSKIWVYAEATDGKVSNTTLELLTKARELADTVECVYGGDGSEVAGTLGEYGASAVYATGDLSGQLQGVPVAALGVVEGALRLFGWGGYPAFIREVGEVEPGVTLCTVEPDATRPYFFANPTRPGYADQTSFRMPKPVNTVRVFLFGESAAKGYPQPRNLSIASFLEAMLEDSWPGRDVEGRTECERTQYAS